MAAAAALPVPPEIALVRGSLRAPLAADAREAQALAVLVCPGDGEKSVRLTQSAADAGELYGIDLLEIAGRLRLSGAPGDAGVVPLPRPLPERPAASWQSLPDTLVLLGAGDAGVVSLRRAGAALARTVEGFEAATVVVPAGTSIDVTRALVEGFLLASYRPPRSGRAAGPTPPARRLAVLADLGPGEIPAVEAALEAARRGADATWTARWLAATPSNIKSPAWFAEEARRASDGKPGVSVVVHGVAWLTEQGFGGLLAVGSGSAYEPRLAVVSYAPPAGPTPSRHVVLVGKGITFDTGGLSLKGRDAMIPMKTDMAGAAAALAAVLGAATAGLAVRVTAVLPLAENALGARSYRPGDVLVLHDGSTVEVRNTDAEGRLVLADALSWSAALDPDVVVDIATLTGAASLGLGRRHAGLYATADDLAEGLLAAGAATGERVWRLPLVPDYGRALDSSVADVANVATDSHVKGGSITAALFLQRFAGTHPWAHLDIAGPARAPKAEHEVTEGATGYGARLLLRWLEDLSA